MKFDIKSVNQNLKDSLLAKIANKTKPPGSLGKLEDLVLQIGLIQESTEPRLEKPHILVFAADHGISRSGVSAFPREVTTQMVYNFLSGGAAINVFCKQNGIDLKVIDAGVDHDFENCDGIIHAKVATGTANMLEEAAMTVEQCNDALNKGRSIVSDIQSQGANVIGFGEMGIGNTSSASLIMSTICDIPLEECIGRGAGLNDEGLEQKLNLLQQVLSKHSSKVSEPLDILRTYGGFESVQICGAMLEAASRGMLILVDGFIATSAFLIAHKMHPEIIDYAVFCHQSDEKGHAKMLDFLKVSPLVDLGMRLGEGSGAAVAYPLIQSAVAFLNEMASFESAGVSNKSSDCGV